MFTRTQYMNKECTHREYHAQFVTAGMKDAVLRHIGLKRLRGASSDEHLNSIPLGVWGSFVNYMPSAKLREHGDFLTMAGVVCIAKEAARQILDEGGADDEN